MTEAQTMLELAPHEKRALAILKLVTEQSEEIAALRATAAAQVTTDQVFKAIEAADAEFRNWRLLPMDDGHARIIRSPAYAPLESRGPGEMLGDEVVEFFNVVGTDAEIKKMFNDRRTFAGIKKALESYDAAR